MRALIVLALPLATTGCNWIGNVSGLNRDANKAIGAGCRQTGRSLEECYQRNTDADRAQVYAGWKEMNEYMAKNQLPTLTPPPPPVPAADKAGAGKKPETLKPARSEPLDPEVEKLMKVIEATNASDHMPTRRQNVADASERLIPTLRKTADEEARRSSPVPPAAH